MDDNIPHYPSKSIIYPLIFPIYLISNLLVPPLDGPFILTIQFIVIYIYLQHV